MYIRGEQEVSKGHVPLSKVEFRNYICLDTSI